MPLPLHLSTWTWLYLLMTDAAQVSRTIDEHRRTAGISTARLADEAAIARTTLIRKLAGGSDFTVHELIRIAAALGVPVVDLLPGRAA